MRKYIFIALCCLMATVSAEATNLVTGRVSNANGTPVSGVRVTAESEDKTASTGMDGTFVFEAETMPVVLKFDHPGYKTSKSAFQQTEGLNEDTVVLEKEDVFENVAYGKQKKDHVTASIYSISGEELLATRANNFLMALQGKVPGLQILQNDGTPSNEAVSIQMRGQDSPNSNAITYMVDGVERDPSTVDLYDIENVTILRDAAASAMYGMRARGGVILINTKRGVSDEFNVNVNVDHSIQSPTRLPDIVSAGDYAKMYNQRQANDTTFADAQDIASGGSGINHSGTSFYTSYEIDRYNQADNTEFFPVRDMMDDFLKEFSQLSRVNVNFQGGSDQLRYYTSVGYHHQSGLFEQEPFDAYSYDSELKTNQFNFRTNLDMKVNPTLDFYVNIGGYMREDNGPFSPIGGTLQKLYETPNNAHNDLTPDGEVLIKRDKLDFRTNQSVYGELNRTGSRRQTETRLGNTFGLKQELNRITEGLSAGAEFSFDILSRKSQLRSREYERWEVATFTDESGTDSLGYNKVSGTNNTTLSDGLNSFFEYSYDMRLSTNYQRTFDDKHDVSAMLLAERYMQQREVLPNNNFMWLSGRATYGFDNRLFLEGNFAYQGSQQYAEDQRFGFFPSVSAGWLVSNEDFMQGQDVVSHLKLRASVGQTGNYVYPYGSANQYLYIDTWNANATEDQLGNPSFQWETYTKYNFGLEVEFADALYLGADYFYHDNQDIIVRNVGTLPSQFMGVGGTSLPPLNIGKTVNNGFELVLGYEKQFSDDLLLNLNGNLSYTENEYKDMAELPYDESYAYAYRQKGYSMDQYWGYETDGLFSSQEEIDNHGVDQSELGGVPIPGDIKYVDLTGDGVVDEKDVAPLDPGSQPDIVYGLNAGLTYKSFDLNIFVNGMAKRNVFLHGFGRWSNRDNFTESMKGAWTAEKAQAGEDISMPRLGSESANYNVSDYWIEDGSYIRLRNLELGFTLPENLTRRINSNSIRVYVNGLNLVTWDNLPNDDFDPETADSNNLNFPVMKAYNFGVSMKF